MTDDKKPDPLEMEKIKLERLKVWGKVISVAITVVLGSVLVAIINRSIQNRQIDLQAIETLGKFVDNALTKDSQKRIRFAEYFAMLTPSTTLKNNWMAYHDNLLQQEKNLKDKEILLAEKAKELEGAKQRGETALASKQLKEVKSLEDEIQYLRIQLASIPKDTDDEYLTVRTAKILYLDKDWKPRTYTANNFEEETVSDDRVVIDKATGLMWQKSGSERLFYEEAEAYVAKLNRDRFADKSDWRLPTLKEAITLLEQQKISDGLFIDSKFDKTQKRIWTSDLTAASSAWVVYFDEGNCYNDYSADGIYYVRAVR